MNEVYKYNPVVSGAKGLIFIGEKVLVYKRDNNTIDHPLMIDIPGGTRERVDSYLRLVT